LVDGVGETIGNLPLSTDLRIITVAFKGGLKLLPGYNHCQRCTNSADGLKQSRSDIILSLQAISHRQLRDRRLLRFSQGDRLVD
jgi:hypothetical protein